MFTFAITPKNYLFLPKKMMNESMGKFFKKFDEVNNKYNKIFIFITSTGGDTGYGIELANRIIKSKSEIITVAHKQCDSAAGVPFICGTKRFVTKNTTMVIHPQTLSCFDIPYENFISFAKIVKQNTEHMEKLYREKTSLPPYIVKLLLTKKGYEFSAKEAVEYRIADRIVECPECVPALCGFQ
jgi:ATP-dependent protease ClpP protease subunit